MDEFEITNKIHEIRSLIASNWVGLEERKILYAKRDELEKMLKELEDAKDAENKPEKT